jgi:hypothetical protein
MSEKGREKGREHGFRAIGGLAQRLTSGLAERGAAQGRSRGRGISIARLRAEWSAIVGPELARISQPDALLRACLCDVGCAVAVHIDSQLRMNFATVNVGVGGSQNDPLLPVQPNHFCHLVLRTDVDVLGAESDDFVALPLPHQCFAQQAGGSENRDTHGRASYSNFSASRNDVPR